MKQYKKKFNEDSKKSPRDVIASFYIIGKTWKRYEDADRYDKDILKKLSPSLLKKGDEYISAIMSHSGGKEKTLKVSWKNENGIVIGAILQYDSEKEINDEGWII